MTAKEMVYDRLQRIPDNATLEDIRGDVETMIAVQKGMDDVRAGRIYSQEQVDEMTKSWITEASGQPVL